MVPFADKVEDKKFARLISTMIDSGLINANHYKGWADDVIAALPQPPGWVLELAMVNYSPDAVRTVNRFVLSEPFESLQPITDEHVACLYHRHASGEISWATFLLEAGRVADGLERCRYECESFYIMLNELDDAEYDSEVAARQQEQVKQDFAAEIDSVGGVFAVFREYRRRHLRAGR